jgi:hypothetical protein
LYCREKQIATLQCSLSHILEFLTDLYEKYMSYSSINSAHSALSAMGIVRDGVSIGSHPIVIRFMKGIYK